MRRAALVLTADHDCPRCKGTGLAPITMAVGEVVYGGPPRRHVTLGRGLCSCVEVDRPRMTP